MKFFIAALLLLFVASVSAQTSWSYCSGTGAGHLSVSSVTLNPDPPVRGTDDKVTLTGTVDETVTGGTISLTIAYGGFFPVYSATYNICDTVTCPYQPGSITSSITVPGTSIPSISPAGEYVGTATLVDQNGDSLACVAVTFNLPAFKDAPAQMCPKAAAELMAQFNGVKF